MTPENYCADKVLHRGTSLYYTLFYTPEPGKRGLMALFALIKELEAILYECAEPSVARMKLTWWRHEIQKTWQGAAPSHPILQALNNLPLEFVKQPALLPVIEQLIDAVEMDLQHNRYLDWPALQKYLTLLGGSTARLSTAILLMAKNRKQNALRIALDQDDGKFMDLLGQFCLYSSLIRDVGLAAQQNRIYVPMSDLREHQLTAAILLNRQYETEFDDLIAQQIARALELRQQAFRAIPSTLTKHDLRILKPIFARITMAQALLKKLAKDPQKILQQRIHVSPTKKLWIAYKVKKSRLKF
ncbi:squalene/phytoene synthase family protein [Brackiella oedipodis]|uniref:squalene/phytoene synthase family protein n=1 Tax=Brackiella oedipodis TaxID=124225 RepID=UPI00048F2360|nr:squalene/phytoene synthase family protein [Brackiella oedipodis]